MSYNYDQILAANQKTANKNADWPQKFTQLTNNYKMHVRKKSNI